MPTRLPRTVSCILIACIYYTQQTDYLKMREHIITSIDAVIRKHPECGIIVTGDFNQLNDFFLKTHYRFVQIVNGGTRGNAVLDKIWTNMDKLYMSPITLSELGKSDHNMVLLKPGGSLPCSTGSVMRVTTRALGENEKALFDRALSAVSWEPLFRLETCEEQYAYYQTMIDFSKAFDLINHNILLEKFQAFGISAPILRWMAAFVLDRTQRVKIGKNYSHTGHPNGGVPQGTICGPKCFMMYINDLSTPVPLYKYVDDSTLFEICEMNSISLMQESVNIAAEWTKNNDMKINSEKSKEMIISYTHGNLGNEVPNILIEGKVVERVDHVKLLGITLSNDLTWKRHVDNIVKKAGKRIYMLYQLKRAGVNQADLVTIYISVLRPVVEYACPVWHTNLPIYLSDNIEMIQKRAVRAIFPGMSYVDILNHINLSTLKERRDYLCKKYFINMQARSHKVNCLLPKKRLVDYNLRHGNMYPLTVTRTNRFKNSLIPWGLYHWQ